MTHEEEARGMTPEIYRRVIEARPELAAPFGISHVAFVNGHYCIKHCDIAEPVHKTHAHALILAHWLEKLPKGVGLGRMIDDPYGEWAVHEGLDDSHVFGATPLLALAEFHVPSSTKGAE